VSFAPSSGGRRLIDWLPTVVSVALLVVSLWVLRGMLHDFRLRDVFQSLRALPAPSVALAFLLVSGSYVLNTVYDKLGCLWIGRKIKYLHLAPASFIGYAFGNTLGMPLLSGGSVRYRLYSSWGFSAAEVTAVVAFGMWTYILGCLLMLGLTFLLSPPAFLPLPLPLLGIRALGFLLVAALGGYVLLNAYGPAEIRIWKKRAVRMPGLRLTLTQIAMASCTILMEASAVYCLIPPSLGVPWPMVVAAFLLSTTLGHISQVPGGVGVMETSMLVMLSSDASRATVLGVLVLYRFFYNLLPLVVAIVMLAVYELFHERGWFRSAIRTVSISEQLVPQLVALTASAGGALLVLGGSLPPSRALMPLFATLPPLLLEGAHLVASLAGLRLLLLAPRLERSDHPDVQAVAVTLAIGIAAHALRSLAWPQTVILLLILACILVAAPVVRRLAGSAPRATTDPEWLLTGLASVCGAVFLASLAYPLALSDSTLWTEFASDMPAGRILRTTLVVVVIASLWIIPGIFGYRRSMKKKR
jgi:phosphatidylglycerol lysyltransferase